MADSKTTALTADTSPSSTDVSFHVKDPGGTPLDRKVTHANLIQKAHGLSDGMVEVASGVMGTATAGTDYYAPGSTDVAVADGGTGASTASGARTNLGLVIGTDVVAPNQDTTGKSAKTDALNSATTAVNVSAAAAPTSGQALIATSSTAATWQSLPGGGDALTSGSLAQFAATTSAELRGVLSDETGSGAAVFATSPALTTPNLGTPSAATLTNATGLPIGTGVSGLGTGVATFLATPSSANLASALTDETGTGAAVFANSPTLVTPALGTPASGVATNLTGTASGLTSGNATQASALKSATTTVNVDSATAPSSGQVLTATSSTAATWQTPSGGASTPRVTIPLINRTNSGDLNTEGMTLDTATGTDASATWNVSTGLQCLGPSVTTGHARWALQATRTSNYVDLNFFDKNPSFIGAVGLYANSNFDAYFGLGGNASVVDASSKGACFLFSKVSGTLTVYARTSSGSAVTDTDITTAAAATSGWNVSGTNYLQYCYIVANGTNFKFYINGTLLATHTTNLPTGALVSNSHGNMFAAGIYANASTAASSQLNIVLAEAQVDII